MVTVMVTVSLKFIGTVTLKVKITVEVTDFYGNEELRLFAANDKYTKPSLSIRI